jgi:predicted RNA-binding Zn-ribbon protein involved in translation (DUF1610 family)
MNKFKPSEWANALAKYCPDCGGQAVLKKITSKTAAPHFICDECETEWWEAEKD